MTVAKGKKLLEWNPATDNPKEILASVMGPSGNLRAPTWRIDDEFLVGFHEVTSVTVEPRVNERKSFLTQIVFL